MAEPRRSLTGTHPLSRRLLPLLLASEQARDGAALHPLDRVRMQKGVFLVAVGGPAEWRGTYEYRPYNWGPYSGTLNEDLALLCERGLLRVAPVPGSRYGEYVSTALGEATAERAWDDLAAEDQAFLRQVRSYVTSRNFARLLRDVYDAYPEYATESLFRPWQAP